MIDERAYELLCCQLGLANEEKAGLRKQVNELIARLKAIEESNKENSKALVDTINELSATVENYRKEMELMRKQLGAKDEVNRMLANEISTPRASSCAVTDSATSGGTRSDSATSNPEGYHSTHAPILLFAPCRRALAA